MYTIFTDTDTDMTPKEAEVFGYHLISMPYSLDEKEIFPYEDFEEFDSHEFYNMLRKGTMPKTSALSPVKYIEYFEPYFQQGQDILYVHFSRAMSGTFSALDIAQKELKEKYPERNLYLVDTKGITIGSLNIVKEIGDMYLQGASVEEILKWAETEVDKFAIYFFAENLTFFRRSGRVNGVTAVMGNLLGVHPIIYMGKDGMMTSIDKARGKKATLEKIMQYVDVLQDAIKSHRVIIGHTDALETAQLLGDMMKKKYGDDLRLEYVVTNPTAGSHCGPNGVGISFHAIER